MPNDATVSACFRLVSAAARRGGCCITRRWWDGATQTPPYARRNGTTGVHGPDSCARLPPDRRRVAYATATAPSDTRLGSVLRARCGNLSTRKVRGNVSTARTRSSLENSELL